MEEDNNLNVGRSIPKYPCSLIYPKFPFFYPVVLPHSSSSVAKYISENQVKNIYTNINHNSEEENMNIIQFTKNDYVKIVQEKRRDFVHTNFEKVLKELFQKLEEEALKMRNCHHEVVFECPEYFDVDKTESVLREYFKDIGFESVASPRKDDTSTIILTIT